MPLYILWCSTFKLCDLKVPFFKKMDFVCDSISWSSFATLDSIPYSILYGVIEHCPKICKVLYGDANTDLTGIGVSSTKAGFCQALVYSTTIIGDDFLCTGNCARIAGI